MQIKRVKPPELKNKISFIKWLHKKVLKISYNKNKFFYLNCKM